MNINCTDPTVSILSIYGGDISIFSPIQACDKLAAWSLECLNAHFGDDFDIYAPLMLQKDDFIAKATATKKEFTNDTHTSRLLEDLISIRYNPYHEYDLYYDIPRLRIIPNSHFLSAGISYNYKAHRDTWYGAQQDQINHWISVRNVSRSSTFFISPSLFNKSIRNSSADFDLDVWDQKYRPMASTNKMLEERPHPVPLEEVDNDTRIGMDIRDGWEVCFSGHHLHGSLENTTERVRLSIDYRVHVIFDEFQPPQNIDSSAKGDYLKYMKQHPAFGNNY